MSEPIRLQIVGEKKSGKTTLIVGLVEELTARGYKVGTVKHTSHDHDFDRPQTDSWRHRKAGAVTTFILSPGGFVMHAKKSDQPTIDKIIGTMFSGLVFVLWEGHGGADFPRIECIGSANRPAFEHDIKLLAVVSDHSRLEGIPNFSHRDVAAIADRLVKRFLPGTINLPNRQSNE